MTITSFARGGQHSSWFPLVFPSGKCPYSRECANYEQDSYTCDMSNDEYGHRCYRGKK